MTRIFESHRRRQASNPKSPCETTHFWGLHLAFDAIFLPYFKTLTHEVLAVIISLMLAAIFAAAKLTGVAPDYSWNWMVGIMGVGLTLRLARLWFEVFIGRNT